MCLHQCLATMHAPDSVCSCFCEGSVVVFALGIMLYGMSLWDMLKVRKIDRKLKACHNPLLDPESDIFKQQAAAAQQQVKEDRESKVQPRQMPFAGIMQQPAFWNMLMHAVGTEDADNTSHLHGCHCSN